MGLGARIRALFRLFVLFTFLLAVALVSAITTIRLTVKSGLEKTPNLVGKSLEQAQRTAGRMGLGVKVEDRLFSEKYPAEQVISQVPAAGESTKVGQDIHMLVSLGSVRLAVPDLVGASARAAEIIAVERGLAMGDVASVHSAGAGADQVVAQDPPPSSTEMRSPAVNLLVSLGEPPAEFVCPDFVGTPISSARQSISAAGFAIGRITTVSPNPAPTSPSTSASSPNGSPGAPANGVEAGKPPAKALASGTILSQSPLPGSKITAGTAFDFEVAQ